ncbi:MAG: ABC transporter permease [Thermoprotei archaeon]|nr:MAG: ABC transporter permease [Thermoprotei archaeon]
MGVLKNYVIPRLGIYVLEIFIGCTISFLIPRFTPIDPVQAVINRYAAFGEFYDPEIVENLIDTLKELYGLKGTLLEQYIGFLKRIIVGDFGPSLTAFPTPVTEIIWRALPWTIGLLSIATILAWIIGNIVGGIAGYFYEEKWAKALAGFATVIRPVPYYIIALLLVLLFAYVFPIFPMGGGVTMGTKPSLTLRFLLDLLKHAFLPALSLILTQYSVQFIIMRSLVINTRTKDYVVFGEAMGLPKSKLLFKYVLRNSLLPQVTGLAIMLGSIFNGALVTELVFSYPGIGTILYTAITTGDFNLMMGIVTYSIIAVATAALLIDLLYPLVDPRIRYR